MPSWFEYVYGVGMYLVLLYMWTIKKNYMAPCYGWGSSVSRLQSHYEETVSFLPLSSQEFPVLT